MFARPAFAFVQAKCPLSFFPVKPFHTDFILEASHHYRSRVVCSFQYWSSGSLIICYNMGGKGLALNMYTKCRPKGTADLRGMYRNKLNSILLFCWYFVDIVEDKVRCCWATWKWWATPAGQLKNNNKTEKLVQNLKIVFKPYIPVFQIGNIYN
jgi:hypothetical protein